VVKNAYRNSHNVFCELSEARENSLRENDVFAYEIASVPYKVNGKRQKISSRNFCHTFS
jgi:hypothetical protein